MSKFPANIEAEDENGNYVFFSFLIEKLKTKNFDDAFTLITPKGEKYKIPLYKIEALVMRQQQLRDAIRNKNAK